MQLSRWLIRRAAIMLYLFGISQLWADCLPDARHAVDRFFAYDYEGYLLSSKGHEAIWKLTEGNGEPPEWPVVVTKSYEIVSATKEKDGCRVGLRFKIYGRISDTDQGLVFDYEPSIEEQSVLVLCRANVCRIKIDFENFQVCSHPSKIAVVKWLDDLIARQKTSSEKKAILSLRERIESLP